MQTKAIMFTGVGGQGSLLASRILGNLLLAEGFDVKVSEVHGMSQRGGAVVTYVKYGEKVFSPVVDKGEADMIIAFERLEAARWISYLKKDGCLIMSTQRLDPMPVIAGAAEYPEDIPGKIKAQGVCVIAADALSAAVEAGSPKASNVVLLGIAANRLGFSEARWLKAIEETVPPKFAEINKKAFEFGKKIGSGD